MKAKLKGFTLVELMAVMVIISMLISLAVPLIGDVLTLSAKKQAAAGGEEFYMAAASAVDTVYSMHKTEFTDSLEKKSNMNGQYCMFITSSDFSAVQCGSSSKNFDYVKGFRDFSGNGNRKGKALVIKHTLEGLNALNRDIGLTREQLRFASSAVPGGTVEDYAKKVNSSTYNMDGSNYNCKQAGVVICCAKAEGRPGEVVYTEYGDENGFLVICINPAWYTTVKQHLNAVKNNPLTAEKEAACKESDSLSPIVITVSNGVYEVN